MSKRKRSVPHEQSGPIDGGQEPPEPISSQEPAERNATSQEEQRRRQGLQLLGEGARLLSQQRPDEAIAKLEQAAALLPDDPAVAINLGGAYILQRRHNKAVAVLEQASQSAPDHPMIWVNLAAAYLGRLEIAGPQQQAKAIQAYEAALRLDPKTPHVHYNLGLIYKDRRDWRRARSHFEQALVVNPADSDAHSWLRRLDDLERQDAADSGTPVQDEPSADLPLEPPG